MTAPAVAASAWGAGTSTRFVGLAAARAASQVVSVVWFLYAARAMPEAEFGTVASGLVFVAVFSGLSDVGTSRSVVRYVAADPATLWSAYGAALRVRLAASLGLVGAVAAGVAVTPSRISATVVLVAGLVATASGVTELAFSGLRSLGRVRTEMVLLVLERLLFVALGVVVVERGGSAVAVLIAYGIANLASAGVGVLAVRRARPEVERSISRFMDREAMVTAAGFALLVVIPRISAVLLALLASSTYAAVFAVGLRPAEALGQFALSVATPLFAIVRGDVATRAVGPAQKAGKAVAGLIALAVLPFVAWLVVEPRSLLDTLFGAERYEGAGTVARLVAVVALGLALRGVGEAMLLAHERAGRFLRVVGAGAVVNLVLGVPLLLAWDATGAAVAMLAGELVMLAALLRELPVLRQAAIRGARPVASVLVVAVAGMAGSGGSPVGAALVTAAALLVAAAHARPLLGQLERRHT